MILIEEPQNRVEDYIIKPGELGHFAFERDGYIVNVLVDNTTSFKFSLNHGFILGFHPMVMDDMKREGVWNDEGCSREYQFESTLTVTYEKIHEHN